MQDQLADAKKRIRITAPAKKSEPSQLSIYQLKNVAPDAVVETVNALGLTKKGRIAVDANTNSLIVMAPKDEHEIIRAMLERIDATAQPSTVRSYRFPPDQADTIRSILAGSHDLRMSYDKKLKSLIVQAPPQTHARVGSIIDKLAAQREDDKKEAVRKQENPHRLVGQQYRIGSASIKRFSTGHQRIAKPWHRGNGSRSPGNHSYNF